jgi:hypothetical protein
VFSFQVDDPPTNGGTAGEGFPGTAGEHGGAGGNAGNVTIYYVSNQSETQPPKIISSGAQSGTPGTGGLPGIGGAVGVNGADSDYTTAQWGPGEPRAAGAPSTPGSTGAIGASGGNGDVLLQQVEVV